MMSLSRNRKQGQLPLNPSRNYSLSTSITVFTVVATIITTSKIFDKVLMINIIKS